MTHINALSRVVAHVDTYSLEEELHRRQSEDLKIREIAQTLETQDFDNYVLVDDLVFRKHEDKLLFIVPETMTENVIRFYHDYMSHCSLEKTVEGILVNYWFPSIRKKVQTYLNNCVTCLLFNTSSHSREGELQITDAPPYPMHTIHVDHFGPLKQSEEGFKHILLAVNAYSRFTLLLPTKSTGTKETSFND